MNLLDSLSTHRTNDTTLEDLENSFEEYSRFQVSQKKVSVNFRKDVPIEIRNPICTYILQGYQRKLPLLNVFFCLEQEYKVKFICKDIPDQNIEKLYVGLFKKLV